MHTTTAKKAPHFRFSELRKKMPHGIKKYHEYTLCEKKFPCSVQVTVLKIRACTTANPHPSKVRCFVPYCLASVLPTYSAL